MVTAQQLTEVQIESISGELISISGELIGRYDMGRKFIDFFDKNLYYVQLIDGEVDLSLSREEEYTTDAILAEPWCELKGSTIIFGHGSHGSWTKEITIDLERIILDSLSKVESAGG